MTVAEAFLVPAAVAAAVATLWLTWGPGALRRVLNIGATIIVFVVTWLAYVLVLVKSGARVHI